MTYAEYLAFERTAETKHEYVNGEVYAMSGGTPEHARLAANLIRQLGNALASRPCAVFTSDARVYVRATGRSTYPDLSVVCGPIERDPKDPDAITNPTVVVEVLSPTSEASDRGDKFAHYRRMPSLQEYVLVGQDAQRIEVFRRAGEGWMYFEAGPGARVELTSLGVGIDVDAVYRDPLKG